MAEEYEVEAIVGRRRDKKGKLEYLLSWVGYTERTWTPVAKCDCPDKIADFDAAHPLSAPSTPASSASTSRTPRRSGKRDTTPANSARSFRSAGRKQNASTSRKEDTPASEAPAADAPATLASILSPIVTPAASPKKTTSNDNNDEPIDISSGEESDGGIEIMDTPSKGKGRGRPKSTKSGAATARTGSSSSERPTTSTATRQTKPVTSPVKNKAADILELTDTDDDDERKVVLPPPSSSTKATNGSPAKKKLRDRSPSKSESEAEKSEEDVAATPKKSGRGRPTKSNTASPVKKKARSPSKSESDGEKTDDEEVGRATIIARGRAAHSKPIQSSPVKKNAKAASESASEGEKSEDDDEGKKETGRGRPARNNPSSPVKKPAARSDSKSGSEGEESEDEGTKKAGRGRGRPAKSATSSPVKTKPAARSPSKSESDAEESEADQELRTKTTGRGRGRPARGNQSSLAKKKSAARSPSKSESEESESEKNSEEEKIKKMKAGERKRTRSMGSPSEEEEESQESQDKEESEEEEEEEERESRPSMIGRHPLAAGPPPKNKIPWGTRTRESSEESAFKGDRGGTKRKRKWKAKESTRHSKIKRARKNFAEPEIVTSESEQTDEESDEEQAVKRKTKGTAERRGRPAAKAARATQDDSDDDEPMEMPSARKARGEQEAAASRIRETPTMEDDDDSIIASPRRNQNRSHVIEVSDDEDEEVVEVDEDSDEEAAPQPANRTTRGIPSVDDFLSELIIEQSYVVPIKVPIKDGDEPKPAGPESDYVPPARPARILSPHEMPRIGVWTRESYEEKYKIPPGIRRENEREKEMACDRDVIRVVAYCSDPVHPFVFAQLAMKEDEEGLPIQEAVQAFHCLLASNLFPRAYSAFVQKMVTTVLKPDPTDEAGPSRNSAPAKKPAPARKTAPIRTSNLESSANHAAERAKRAGKRGG